MKKIRVLFQGDSITDAGRNRLARHGLAGYAQKTADLINKKEDKFDCYNRGVGGNRTKNLLRRYRRHFVAMHPDLVTVLIGINDIWRKYDRNSPTTPEQYEHNLTTLLTGIKKDTGAKVILLSPFLTPDPNGLNDRMRADVDTFIAVNKSVAQKHADGYLNIDIPLNNAAAKYGKEAITKDGIHPVEKGQEIIAELLAEQILNLYA